jgi:hypothetical protein
MSNDDGDDLKIALVVIPVVLSVVALVIMLLSLGDESKQAVKDGKCYIRAAVPCGTDDICRYSATVDCESLDRLVKESKDDRQGKTEKTN